MKQRRQAPPAPREGPLFSLSEEETFDIGRALGQRLTGGELLLLVGQLGIGKTVFARGVASGLGIPADDVCSPSYSLIQEYKGGRVTMYHVDLYRIEDVRELGTLGLEELMATTAVVVIEWGDRLPPADAADALTVRFQDIGEASRRIDFLTAAAGQAAPSRDA